MIGGIENEPAVRAALMPGERVLWHSHPGAGRLFLSVVPSLLRDIVFLGLIGFAIYAGAWQEADALARVVIVLVTPILLWSLAAALRKGTGARTTHYLVTDRRILILSSGRWSRPFVILPWMPKDVEERHRVGWLDGPPQGGSVSNRQGTIRLRYIARRQRSKNYPDMVYRSHTIPLYAVTDPDKAVETIVKIRQDHRGIVGDEHDSDLDADA